MQTVQVGNKIPATLLVAAGDGPTLLANADQNNTIFLGDDYAIQPGDPTQVIPLGPQATVVVNGEKNVFGICSSGQSAACDVVTGGLSFFLRLVSLTLPLGATTGPRIVLDGLRGAIFIYNASNQLVGSWAAAAGTDGLGNAYPAELQVQDQAHARQIQLALYFIQLTSIAAGTLITNGLSFQLLDATAVTQPPQGIIAGPQAGTKNTIDLILGGQSADGTTVDAVSTVIRTNAGGLVATPKTAVFEVANANAIVATMLGFYQDNDISSVYRFTIDGNGKIQWGPGGTTGPDTDLYRTAANALKTDGSLTVVNTFMAGLIETATTNPSIQIDAARNALFAYTASNDLIASIGAISGTDFFGHAYPVGFNGINIPIETETSGQQTFTLASAVAVTGLSAALVPGTYSVEMEIYWVPTGVIGSNHTHSFAFTGTASAGAFNAISWQAQTANAVQQNMSFTTGTTFPVALVNSPTHVGFPGFTRVKARIVVSAAGTLTTTITLGTAGDNLITEPGSYLKVTRLA